MLAASAALVTPEAVMAQEEDGPIRVRSILVSANRVLQELMDVPMTVNVVTAEDLERQPYTNINDVLASVPGVSKAEASGARAGSSKISIRGEEIARTLFIIDGVKVADKDNSEPALLIDLSQVERIEIIKGPASVLYGSEAIGGVVNVITKKGGDRPIGFSQNLVLDSSTESVDVMSAVYGRKGGFNYRFSGSGVNAKDRKVPADSLDGDRAYSSSYRTRYYSGKLGYDWGEHSFSLSADRYENKSNYSISGLASLLNNRRMRLDPNDRTTVIASLALRELGDTWKRLTLTASHQKTERSMVTDFRGGTSPTTNMLGEMKSEQTQLSLSAQSEWSFPGHYLIAGLEYEGDDVKVANEAEYYIPLPPVSGRAKVRQHSLDVFAQDEWALTDDLKTSVGLRFSAVSGELKSREGTTYPGLTGKKDSDSHLVGSIGAVYRGFRNLALRAQYSQGYRYPTVRQLYTGSSAHGGGSPTLPNPDLKPETSNNYEIGARYLDEDWDVDLALFYTESKNFIQIVSAVYNDGIRSFINGDRAKSYGAELSLSRSFRWGETVLTPYASGAYLHRELTMNSGPSAGRSTSHTLIPPYEGKVGLKLETPFGEGRTFYGDLRADMASTARNSINDPGQGRDPSIMDRPETYPAWQTLNLTLGFAGGGELRYNVSLAFRNIFNQSYFDSRGTDSLAEPGFHVVLGVGVQY
jgi:hemoglobin/transferrin/lactoferrin receptor protein